mgnify:FL=1
MTINTIPFGYDENAADRIQEHVDRINEQHSKEMFSKKQLLDLLDEVEDRFLQGSNSKTEFTQVDFMNAMDRVRQRLLRNEV